MYKKDSEHESNYDANVNVSPDKLKLSAKLIEIVQSREQSNHDILMINMYNWKSVGDITEK